MSLTGIWCAGITMYTYIVGRRLIRKTIQDLLEKLGIPFRHSPKNDGRIEVTLDDIRQANVSSTGDAIWHLVS